MTLCYPEALPLRHDLREGHAAAWADIAQPGVSWTGAERVAILAEARAALDCSLCGARKSALSPNAVEGDHDTTSTLAAPIVDGIHRLRTDPQRLTRAWFDSLVPDQLSQPAYAELVSVVCTSVIIDTQHNALGLPVADLPDPIEGEPGGDLLDDTVDIGAWLPVMKAEADLADTGLPSVPNIARAMSLVPSAAALFFGAFRPHYQLQKIPLAINQAQAEFIASRVSALNQCFY
jgi:hypothetical protein